MLARYHRTMPATTGISIRNLATCAALFAFAMPCAEAADHPESAGHAVTLAVDFCGVIAGAPADTVDGVIGLTARKIPGLNVTEPLALDQVSESEGVRAAFKQGLMVADTDKLRIAAFSAAPTVNSRPFAVLNQKTTACLVIETTDRKDTGEALNTRLTGDGSAWSRDRDLAAGIPKWSRAAPFGDRAFVAVSSIEGLTRVLVGVEERPPATPEQVADHFRSAIEPCIAGIIGRKPADAPAFAGAYAEIAREKHPDHPEVDVVRLRATMPGPISILEVRSMNGESLCEFFTSDAQQAGDTMLAAVIGLISGLPQAKQVNVKAKGEVPAHQAWRVRRPGSSRTAELRAERDDKDQHIVIVTIRRHGWFLY